MCVPNLEFQLDNPTTQVALFAICNGNCTDIRHITWNIYPGSMNVSSNYTKWTLFDRTNSYQNIWFFDSNTSNFTALNQLFLSNNDTNLWRFEVVYTFRLETSSSALNFIINQPPYNGSCEISPRNDTTNTVFTITCPNWFDDDQIKEVCRDLLDLAGYTPSFFKDFKITFTRIVGSGTNGFRCLVGFYATDLGPNTLSNPQSMPFDSYGNIFATDSNNHRVQNFF